MSQRIAIYLGANHPTQLAMDTVIQQLMANFADKHLTVVYGGAADGLMGVLAEQATQHSVPVIGVLSKDLPEETVAIGLSEQHTVDTIKERKARMIQLSDAYIVLPGGIGTLDELFSTWCFLRCQLRHDVPIGLLNIDGYFDHLLAFCDHMHTQGMISTADREQLLVAQTPEQLVAALI